MQMINEEIEEILKKQKERREKYFKEFKEKMDTDPKMKRDRDYRHRVAQEIIYRELNDSYD